MRPMLQAIFLFFCLLLIGTQSSTQPQTPRSQNTIMRIHLQQASTWLASTLASSGVLTIGKNEAHAVGFFDSYNKKYSVKLPLYKYDGVLCTVYELNNVKMQAIVDTGSPFLVVPSVCTREWGCLSKQQLGRFTQTNLEDTIEIFGGQNYESEWKVGDRVMIGDVELKEVVFPLVGEDVLRPPGGVFMGLIKYKSNDIRPTFLSQTNFSCIRLNLPDQTLELTSEHLIGKKEDAISLLDLRNDGDPVRHYTALIKELYINGKRIGPDKTLYAVFDTGTSGCVLQDELFNDYETPNPPREIKVILESEEGNEVVLLASARSRKNVFVVTASDIGWFKYQRGDCIRRDRNPTCKKIKSDKERPLVVVIGTAFLEDRTLTIDADQNRLLLSPETAYKGMYY